MKEVLSALAETQFGCKVSHKASLTNIYVPHHGQSRKHLPKMLVPFMMIHFEFWKGTWAKKREKGNFTKAMPTGPKKELFQGNNTDANQMHEWSMRRQVFNVEASKLKQMDFSCKTEEKKKKIITQLLCSYK